MWVLIHTHPKSSRLDMRMARPWFRVHTDDARPYSTPLAHATAWSSSLNRCTVITGPNTSCWTMASSWRTSLTTVGS